MKMVKVTGGVIKVGPGQVISLDEKQFAARKHMLEDTFEKKGKRVHAIVKTAMEFKVGEVLGFDKVEKAHGHLVEEIGEPSTSKEPALV